MIERYVAPPYLLVFLTGLWCAAPLRAQESPLWGTLTPGLFAVGFRAVYRYDFSRVWKSKYDADGRLVGGERARPLRIALWYPAKRQPDPTPPLPYEAYLHLRSADSALEELDQLLDPGTCRSSQIAAPSSA